MIYSNWRVFLKILILMVGTGFLCLETANYTPLMDRLRIEAERTASEALNQTVTIGKLQLSLLHGLRIYNLKIQSSPAQAEPLLRAEQVSGGLLLVPTRQGFKVFIPTLRIIAPDLTLMEHADGSWGLGKPSAGNQSSLSAAAPSAAPFDPQKAPIWLSRIILKRGQIRFLPKNQSGIEALKIQRLQMKAQTIPPHSIRWHITGILGHKGPNDFELSGSYDAVTQKIQLAGQAALPLSKVLYSVSQYHKIPIQSLEGTIHLLVSAQGNLKDQLRLKTKLRTQELAWAIPSPFAKESASDQETFTGEGDLLFNGSSTFVLTGSPITLDDFKEMDLQLELKQLEIGPIPEVGRFKEISGIITWNGEELTTKDLDLKLPSGDPIQIKAQLMNDESQSFSMAISGSVPIQKLLPLIPVGQRMPSDLQLRGNLALNADLKGRLLPTLSWEPSATIKLTKGALLKAERSWLHTVSATLHWKPELLTLTEFSGQLSGQPLKLEGSLVNFKQPEVNLEGSWGKVSAQTQLSLGGDRLEIRTLTASLERSRIEALGEIHGFSQLKSGRSGPEGLTANLSGETQINIKELRQFLEPDTKEAETISGTLTGRWTLGGPLLKPETWDLMLKARAPTLQTGPLEFKQVELDSNLQGGQFFLDRAQARWGGGICRLNGMASYEAGQLPWKAELRLEDIHLDQLSQSLNWKERKIGGMLQAQWKGSGSGNNLRILSGRGTVQVSGGEILELPFLGLFANLITLPQFEKIVFTQAGGLFNLDNGRLFTEGFELKSAQATITINGSGGYLEGADSSISLTILPTLSSELIPKDGQSQLGKIIAQGSKYLVGEIQVTGTWANPIRKFIPKGIGQILNEQIFNLQDIFEDIF